ncbi:Stf0 family sulfotransferase [Kordiimonas aestuarii]|uniref:Stf0 family sulfotransferase n=1 Tax=Kordiimonas aestuarii TaxID=1005925 RepID=UPI0021D1A548|nr:Stf0 family sulfotransferase [Kordiimonas aestuarii]
MTLFYSTNSPTFDFPKFNGTPKTKYVIASTPRSGSNLLTRYLWLSKQAGAPEEYFASRYVQDFDSRWNMLTKTNVNFESWVKGEKKPNIAHGKYLEKLQKVRTSPNGVFGIKIHVCHLDEPINAHVDFKELFADYKIVRIRRKDLVRQAISHTIARQTNIWILDNEWLKKNNKTKDPVYDFDEISKNIKYLEELEQQWDRHVKNKDCDVFQLHYEDLSCSPRDSIARVFKFLNIGNVDDVPKPNISKQSNEINEHWYNLYQETLQRKKHL